MSGLGFRAKLVFMGRTRVALDLGVNCRGIVEEYNFGFNAWVLGNNNVYHDSRSMDQCVPYLYKLNSTSE